MASYAASTDMTARFDETVLKDLCSDTGTPITDLSTNTRMTTALSSATGIVNAALSVGDMYNLIDVAAMTGEDLAYLKQIVCERALIILIQARPQKWGDGLDKLIERNEKTLDQIRGGARVFQIEENIDAGLPTIDGPDQSEYQTLNLLPDRVRNFFPNRQQRLPIGR